MSRARLAVLTSSLIALGPAGPAMRPGPRQEVRDQGREAAARALRAGVMVGKTLYIAGKGDYRPNAEFPEKVKNCLGEIRKTLAGRPAWTWSNVVKSFVYLEDRDKYAEMNKYYGEFFQERPARADDAGRRPGARRLAARDHLHRLRRPRRRGRPSARPARASRTAPASWRATRSMSRARATSSPTAATPPTFEEQVRQAMRNVETTLKQAGLDFRNVVMSHVFLDKYENLEVGQPRLQRVLRGRQRARLRHRVRRLDPRRLARRGHLHRHDRPGRLARSSARPASSMGRSRAP